MTCMFFNVCGASSVRDYWAKKEYPYKDPGRKYQEQYCLHYENSKYCSHFEIRFNAPAESVIKS